MAKKKNAVILSLFVILIAAAAAVFVSPRGPLADTRPWRLGLDLVGGAHLTYEVDLSDIADADRESVVSGLRDVIERRVNLFGVSEPQVFTAKSGESQRLIVELAGITDIGQAIKLIGETPILEFAEVSGGTVSQTTEGLSQTQFTKTKLTGRYIIGAQIQFDQTTGAPRISLEFNKEGGDLFEQITKANVGKQIAVFLDGQLITAPVVQEAITGGKATITGQFTVDEARTLVARFNAGALPAPITLISQQTVGATLGIDSLRETIIAGAIGTLAVLLFMLAYYRALGLFAAAALLVYIALTLALFKLFGITMTLSGVAGIILSIGMAVDANVLIFERTKEEVRRGLTRTAAIEEGFKRAWLSIRDSNVATIITSIILYYLTTGFIKGFALALLLGVLVSMFSAITVTRTFLRAFTKNNK